MFKHKKLAILWEGRELRHGSLSASEGEGTKRVTRSRAVKRGRGGNGEKPTLLVVHAKRLVRDHTCRPSSSDS